MNIVCDTNILISGILFGGHARTIIQLASRGSVTNFLSPTMLRELEDVLARPKFGLTTEQVLNIAASKPPRVDIRFLEGSAARGREGVSGAAKGSGFGFKS